MARPTKLTATVQNRIVSAIRQGATYELAAQYGGITYETFNEWMKQGQQDTEGIFSEFSEAIKKAEGAAAVKWLRVIEAAGKESWQAMAWKLERRYPRDYGRQVQEHVGDAGQPIILKVTYGERTNNTPPPTTPETSAGD